MRFKLNQLIDELEDDILGPALRAAVNTLPDEAIPRVLRRMLKWRPTKIADPLDTLTDRHSPGA